MKWFTAVSWLFSLVLYGLVLQAGYNLSRLDVPDTVAGPAEYGLYVAGPLVGAFLAAFGRAIVAVFAGAVSGAASGSSGTATTPTVKPGKLPAGLSALGKLARDACASGALDHAQVYLNAAKSIYPADKSPEPADGVPLKIVTGE